MKNFTLHFDTNEQCDTLDRAWFGEMWSPVQRHTYHVQASVTDDSIADPADLDLEDGYSEPDLCFSKSQVRDPAYALCSLKYCAEPDGFSKPIHRQSSIGSSGKEPRMIQR